ncbi:type III pantothenate kinase [Desulfobotulus sp. H1]|uniref:Type III pantothenate kinase n=1 Tax=Desulfobotulus pelophilus TaxID=2823377 RepID=A0ABT3N507_9BACT|nr:type III pantothenate kinase [Desulfobotulus pelophilus]MCW7752533.1 type III pantothenate kinase [Desulfobotulus pelophilus]
MLLVIDVGNTNTVIGIFQGETLRKDWRIPSRRDTTPDEFHVLARNLFQDADIPLTAISKTIVSCVVPPMIPVLDAFCRRHIPGPAPHWVGPASVKGWMPILYTNPLEVGADRIVNAVAAYHRYPQALIVIDFGTATTFDVISPEGAYLGGAISPGIAIAADALFQRASKLPRVALFNPPASIIGKDTETSLKSGIIHGYAALVDGMVDKIRSEMTGSVKIIATGGLAPLMQEVSRTIEIVDSTLTLEGLRLLSERAPL